MRDFYYKLTESRNELYTHAIITCTNVLICTYTVLLY